MNKLVPILLALLLLGDGTATTSCAQTQADATQMQTTTARFKDYTTAFMSFADTMKGTDRDNANAFGAIATISSVRYEFLSEELLIAASLVDPADKEFVQKTIARRLNEELNYHDAMVKELSANIARTRKTALVTLANKLKQDLLKSEGTLQRLARNLQLPPPQDPTNTNPNTNKASSSSTSDTTQKPKANSE